LFAQVLDVKILNSFKNVSQDFLFKQHFFLFYLGLPAELTETLNEITSLVRSKIKLLQEKVAKAKVIQEKIKQFESPLFYSTLKEMEKLKKMSAQKVEEAISLQNSIEQIKNETGYLTKADAEKLSNLMELTNSKLPLN
jgi:hypothetical protein